MRTRVDSKRKSRVKGDDSQNDNDTPVRSF